MSELTCNSPDMPSSSGVGKLSHGIRRALHRLIAVAEEVVDGERRASSRRMGIHEPAHIAAYDGYVDRNGTHVFGRVLSRKPGGGPTEEDSILTNLANTWHRWESDEGAGVKLRLRCGNHEAEVVTDEEGYYHHIFPPIPVNESLWSSAEASTLERKNSVTSTHPILTPSADAEYGIVSDLDDTVIHTGITDLWLAAKLTFLGNARTRKPLDGVAELYSALQKGMAAHAVNPIFYVSSSPWNLHDLLMDFLKINGIPRGPILLRDIGLDRKKFIKEPGHGHKLDKALALIDGYHPLPFVLIGDSGQEDPDIYATVCEERPGRIKAIYIRDVDPDHDSGRDAIVHHAMRRAEKAGVPMILAANSLAMSAHANRLGLIPASAIPEVLEEVHKDVQRPGAGEQALKEATGVGVEGRSDK